MPSPRPSILAPPALDGWCGAAAALLGGGAADARARVEEERVPAAGGGEEELRQLQVEARVLQLVAALQGRLGHRAPAQGGGGGGGGGA